MSIEPGQLRRWLGENPETFVVLGRHRHPSGAEEPISWDMLCHDGPDWEYEAYIEMNSDLLSVP